LKRKPYLKEISESLSRIAEAAERLVDLWMEAAGKKQEEKEEKTKEESEQA